MNDRRLPHTYGEILVELLRRMSEPAPGRIQILTGPRQVGKTHLLREIEATADQDVVYAAADAPAASLPGWWELQWREARRLAAPGRPSILMMDEIQYVPDWGRRLKSEYDILTHRADQVHVIVSGSSSLRLGSGARESMAGRFERLQLTHWPVSEFARRFSLDQEEALRLCLRCGTYPGAVPFLDEPRRWSNYVLEAIIEPAIGRDIVAETSIRKPALLRQLFALAAGHPAEIISLQKLRGQLEERGALETIAHYLQVLEEAYLVAALSKASPSTVRRRAAPPKLIVLNQGILGAMSSDGPESAMRNPTIRGRWVENACIAHAWNSGQRVQYWRAEPLEVDAVISGDWGRWAMEVKTGPYRARDLAGLLEFTRLHGNYRPLVLHDQGEGGPGRSAGLAHMSWEDFLLSGPPA